MKKIIHPCAVRSSRRHSMKRIPEEVKMSTKKLPSNEAGCSLCRQDSSVPIAYRIAHEAYTLLNGKWVCRRCGTPVDEERVKGWMSHHVDFTPTSASELYREIVEAMGILKKYDPMPAMLGKAAADLMAKKYADLLEAHRIATWREDMGK